MLRHLASACIRHTQQPTEPPEHRAAITRPPTREAVEVKVVVGRQVAALRHAVKGARRVRRQVHAVALDQLRGQGQWRRLARWGISGAGGCTACNPPGLQIQLCLLQQPTRSARPASTAGAHLVLAPGHAGTKPQSEAVAGGGSGWRRGGGGGRWGMYASALRAKSVASEHSPLTLPQLPA